MILWEALLSVIRIYSCLDLYCESQLPEFIDNTTFLRRKFVILTSEETFTLKITLYFFKTGNSKGLIQVYNLSTGIIVNKVSFGVLINADLNMFAFILIWFQLKRLQSFILSSYFYSSRTVCKKPKAACFACASTRRARTSGLATTKVA